MQTQTLQPTPGNLRFLAERLRADELVAVPSETVYGLAGNGLSENACAQIFAAKDRPRHDPLILHLHSAAEAQTLCVWHDVAQVLAGAFWPGPLTLVLPKQECVPDLATSGLPSVALRVPSHPVLRELLSYCQIPLAAPSANPFGYLSPTTAAHVHANLAGRIPYILDGGRCSVGIESTILDLRTPETPVILRPGVISAAEIEAILGRKVARNVNPAESRSIAPGQLDSHYSPRTPLEIVPDRPSHLDPAWAYVAFSADQDAASNTYGLSSDGDGSTAARNLYALLRQLDEANYERILVQSPPANATHLDALWDRLTRAALK